MIIDACMFFNELDLLEIRLNELDSIVDKFVIVESLETFGSSAKKSAVLRDNWSVVKPFEHKIKYTLLPKLEPAFTDSTSGWYRELFQRNELLTSALTVSSSPDDVLIASDCDEIPRAAVIRDSIPLLSQGMQRLKLLAYVYNVNWTDGEWRWGPTLGTIAQYQAVGGSQNARSFGYHVTGQEIPDAGWHFSYFGGISGLRTKISSFAHASDDFCKEFLAEDDKTIAADIAAGRNLYHSRKGVFTPALTNDPTLPAHFLNNLERYKHLTSRSYA
jgi:beta-1,4-mannosyl-glycoprotein beta-1,4-N-acetylglucosaminyltransferase